MSKKLYITNVAWGATNESLKAHLGSSGSKITSVTIITDRETGRSRGFAFVEVAHLDDMQSIIQEFNEKDFAGRTIFISEAKPKEQKPRLTHS